MEMEHGHASDPAGKPHIALDIRNHLGRDRGLRDPGTGSGDRQKHQGVKFSVTKAVTRLRTTEI